MPVEISLDHSVSKVNIQSYRDGRIVINGNDYKQSTALTNELIHSDFSLESIHSLKIEHLKSLNFESFEVILVGTGEELQFPDWNLIEEAQCLGSPLEVMSTGAACRTFTILAGEGRKVLAILFP